jgi:hypothetical protein
LCFIRLQILKIPLDDIKLNANNWFPKLIDGNESAELVCFPYTQHFISDSPGARSNIKNKNELIATANSIDFKNTPKLPTKSFYIMFIVGAVLSLTINISLLLLYIFKD